MTSQHVETRDLLQSNFLLGQQPNLIMRGLAVLCECRRVELRRPPLAREGASAGWSLVRGPTYHKPL